MRSQNKQGDIRIRITLLYMLSSDKFPISYVPADEWDSVINFESAAYDNGVDEGRRDAKESGEMYNNGVQSGFLKGARDI